MPAVAFFLGSIFLGKFLVPHCCDLLCLVFSPVFGANMKKIFSPGVLEIYAAVILFLDRVDIYLCVLCGVFSG